MKTRVLIAAILTSFVAPIGFAQMYGGSSQAQSQKPPQPSSGGMQNRGETTTTTTKKVMPVGVKGYLDEQLANSKDKKFHVSLNGKDLPLTPVKIHEGGKSVTPVDMKGADGKMYEIDFSLTNGQVTGARVGKVNGKAP
jgi:hypothetical protein